MEGVALGNGGRVGDGTSGPSSNGASGCGAADSIGLSTVSSPTTLTSPTTVVDQQPLKMNGATASSQNLASTIDPKALIIEDEPTTEWTPEIPFKNVRAYCNNYFHTLHSHAYVCGISVNNIHITCFTCVGIIKERFFFCEKGI